MPRKRHVSRNFRGGFVHGEYSVMPRKRHVSRNLCNMHKDSVITVMPRKRHVSRNAMYQCHKIGRLWSCLARGM